MVFHRILDFKTRLDFYPASIFFCCISAAINIKPFSTIVNLPCLRRSGLTASP